MQRWKCLRHCTTPTTTTTGPVTSLQLYIQYYSAQTVSFKRSADDSNHVFMYRYYSESMSDFVSALQPSYRTFTKPDKQLSYTLELSYDDQNTEDVHCERREMQFTEQFHTKLKDTTTNCDFLDLKKLRVGLHLSIRL